MILASAAAAAALLSQPKVDITTYGSNLRAIAQEISRQTGIAIRVDGGPQEDILVVLAKDADGSTLLKHIADVTGSKLVQDGQGVRILRGKAEDRAQRKKDLKARAERIDAAIDELSAAPPAQGGRSRQPAGPWRAAIKEILGDIKGESLAEIKDGHRVVYSTRPTSVQVKMPSRASQAFSGYIAAESELYKSRSGQARRGQDPSTATKGNIAIRRVGGALSLELSAVDARGQRVLRRNLTLTVKDRLEKPAPALGTHTEEPIELSDIAKSILRALKPPTAKEVALKFDGGGASGFVSPAVAGEGFTDPLSAEALQMLIKSDEIEPLGLFLGEALSKAAGAKELQLVAHLPDSAFAASTAWLGGTGLKPNSVFGIAQAGWGLNLESKDGWLVIKPTNVSESWDSRANRSALAKLSKSVSKSPVSLNDMAAYARYTRPAAFAQSFDLSVLAAVDAAASIELMRSRNNRETLILFASLGAPGLQAMEEDGVLLGTQAGFKDEAHSLVYNSWDGPKLWSQAAPAGRQTELVTIIEVRAQSAGGSPSRFTVQPINAERTDAMPFGVPGDTMITLRKREQVMVQAFTNMTGRSSMMSAQALGQYRAKRESPRYASSRSRMPEYRAYEPVTQTTYTFEYKFAEGASMSRTLRDIKKMTSSGPGTYGQLPPAFVEQSNQAFENSIKAIASGAWDRTSRRDIIRKKEEAARKNGGG
jgi:hypothetical protein